MTLKSDIVFIADSWAPFGTTGFRPHINTIMDANPAMILLDEPSEGLAPLVVRNLAQVIGQIRERGMTLLLADQNLKFCRKVCERGYILEKGRIVHEGTMQAIWENEEVIKRYLVL